MTLLLAFFLLLVMLSLIMTLNAMTRLDVLRKQNEFLNQQMQHLQHEHQKLLAQIQQAAARTHTDSQAQEAPSIEPMPTAQASEQSPQSVLRQQLAALQEVLKSYAERHQQRYPSSLESLIRFANRRNLQKVVRNPYTGSRNPLVSEDVCLDITHNPADEGLPEQAGRLLYQAHLDADGHAENYTLAAFDRQGILLKDEQGEVLTLEASQALKQASP